VELENVQSEKGKTLYQLRRHLSYMHTTNYIPFIQEKATY